MVKFNYNSELDILTVDKDDREPEEYNKSLVLGGYTVDMNEEDEVMGIEIINATKNLPYTKDELKSIGEVEISETQNSEATTITVELRYSGNKGAFTIGYPAAEA